MKRRVLLTVAAWAGALGLAFAAGVWVRDRRTALEEEEGKKMVLAVGDLARKAREAAAAKDPKTGSFLEELSGELGRTPSARGRPPYAGLMIDLASLGADDLAADPSRLSGIRFFLDEAWAAEGLPPAVRARIARDQGALAILDGDLTSAETWYKRSLEADPTDNPSAKRLETIARMRKGE